MHMFLGTFPNLIKTSYLRDITFSGSLFCELHCYMIITVHWIVFVINMLETQIKYSKLCY